MTLWLSHLAEDQRRRTSPTLCGAPWQAWQAPVGWRGPTIPPAEGPPDPLARIPRQRTAADAVRACPACRRLHNRAATR
jgi:hypothetical protein